MATEKTFKPQHIYNELYEVLAEAFPSHRSKHGIFDVPGFAADLGKSHETIYKALRADRLHLGVAHEILRLSRRLHPEIPLYWSNLARFVLPDYKRLTEPMGSEI